MVMFAYRLAWRLVLIGCFGMAFSLMGMAVLHDTYGKLHQAVGVFLMFVIWFGYECVGLLADQTIFKDHV